jgi:hypothetical protein
MVDIKIQKAENPNLSANVNPITGPAILVSDHIIQYQAMYSPRLFAGDIFTGMALLNGR